jgi:YVTN family beta-propeller protein
VTRPRRRVPAVLCLVLIGLAGTALLGRALAPRRAAVGVTRIARVPVGMDPSAVVIDPGARRALVLNAIDTTISVLDERTGAPLATTTVGSNGGAHPVRLALDAPAGHALVLTDDGSLGVLSVRSGRVLHSVLLGGSPSAIAVDESRARAFVTEADAGAVAIVDTRTGALLRAVPVGPYPEEVVFDRRTGLVFVANQGDATVSVLDARTGRLARTLRLGDTPTGLAIGDRDRALFIAGAHGSITGVDAATGARRFQRVVSPRPTTALRRLLLAVDDARGTLLAAHGARIDELDPSTGRLIAIILLPSTVTAVAANPATGGAMATVRGAADARGQLLGDGSLLVFDARGQRLAAIPIGVDPSALAVDPGNGRVLVADTNLNPDGSPVPPHPAPTPPLTRFLSRLRSWLPFLPSVAPAPVPARSTTGAVDVLRLDMR